MPLLTPSERKTPDDELIDVVECISSIKPPSEIRGSVPQEDHLVVTYEVDRDSPGWGYEAVAVGGEIVHTKTSLHQLAPGTNQFTVRIPVSSLPTGVSMPVELDCYEYEV